MTFSRETVSGLGSPIFSGICEMIPACLAPPQPASIIFVSALFLSGFFFLWSALLLRKASSHRKFSSAFTLVGAAWRLVPISYLPIYLGLSRAQVLTVAAAIHITGATVVFILTPVAAVSAFRFTRSPFRYLSVMAGLVSIAALLLLASGSWLGLGLGGVERLLLYPIFLWLIGFGAYLFGGLEGFGVKNSQKPESLN